MKKLKENYGPPVVTLQHRRLFKHHYYIKCRVQNELSLLQNMAEGPFVSLDNLMAYEEFEDITEDTF